MAKLVPELVGGSADLAPSNLTKWSTCRPVQARGGGNYIHYGVREFGMAAIMSGLALHGGLRPFAGTFLMFSEYARNALRMAALMKINPIYVSPARGGPQPGGLGRATGGQVRPVGVSQWRPGSVR